MVKIVRQLSKRFILLLSSLDALFLSNPLKLFYHIILRGRYGFGSLKFVFPDMLIEITHLIPELVDSIPGPIFDK